MFEANLDKVEGVARTLFGQDWRRPLARALAPYRPQAVGKPVEDSRLYEWTSGERPIPNWVVAALPMIARDRANELNTAGRAARALSLELAGLTEEQRQSMRRELAAAPV